MGHARLLGGAQTDRHGARRLPGMKPVLEDIDAMQVRIAKAEADRDTWRQSGMQEKYLEAYSTVEALELQLDLLRRIARLPAP